jgi:hypothetical protein
LRNLGRYRTNNRHWSARRLKSYAAINSKRTNPQTQKKQHLATGLYKKEIRGDCGKRCERQIFIRGSKHNRGKRKPGSDYASAEGGESDNRFNLPPTRGEHIYNFWDKPMKPKPNYIRKCQEPATDNGDNDESKKDVYR